MSVAILGSLIIWLIVAVIVIAIVVYFVNWLYHRSSKEVSFVRTGLFGEKVVINSGAFVLPFIHEITPVNMNVLRMQVVRIATMRLSRKIACASTSNPNSTCAYRRRGMRSRSLRRRLGGVR